MNKEELCILKSVVKHLEAKHVHTRSCCTHTNTLANVGGVQCFHSKLSLLNSVSTVSIPRLDYSKYLIAANGFTHQHMVINASDTIKEHSTSFGGTISLFGRYSTLFFLFQLYRNSCRHLSAHDNLAIYSNVYKYLHVQAVCIIPVRAPADFPFTCRF